MGPEIRIENWLDKRIDFLMEVAGEVVWLGVCRIRSVEPNKISKVSQRKVLRYCHRHQTDQISWRIRVIVDGKCTGLVIEPIHLISYNWIVFVPETDDDGSIVVKAKGLRSRGKTSVSRFLSQLRRSFGLGSKRHRECRMLEEMYGLEDICEVPMGDEGIGGREGEYFQQCGHRGCCLAHHNNHYSRPPFDQSITWPQACQLCYSVNHTARTCPCFTQAESVTRPPLDSRRAPANSWLPDTLASHHVMLDLTNLQSYDDYSCFDQLPV